VARRRCDIDLQRQAMVSLQHAMMNILNTFEPGHSWIMNMVGFVIEDREFFDLANDFP